MEIIIKDIISILDYTIYKKESGAYKKYVNKRVDYNIEYVSPIDITISPKVIYIFTDNIKTNYNDRVLKFYIELLYNIHQNIDTRIVPSFVNSNIGMIKNFEGGSKINNIRGIASYPVNGIDYEIKIYNETAVYQIIICRSTVLKIKPVETLSVVIIIE